MIEQPETAQVAAVIDGFLRGDGEHYRALQSLVRRFVGAQHLNRAADREEIAADILAALYRNLKEERFRGDSLKALEVYLYSMVKHTVAKHLRRVHRVEYWDQLPEKFEIPDHPYDSGVTKRDLSDKILAQLDERCRELMNLKFRQFCSDQELADRYGKTKNAMSTAISRCVKKAQELDIVKEIL